MQQFPQRGTSRIKGWTSTGEHHFAQDASWIQKYVHLSISPCSRAFGKELAETVIANLCDDAMSSGPDVRDIESWISTEATELLVATEGVNADQVVERDGGASRQLDQNATTVATKQRARTPSTANNAEEGVVELRNFDGHQDRGKFIAKKKREFDQMETFSVIPRVKSEAVDGPHVRF